MTRMERCLGFALLLGGTLMSDLQAEQAKATVAALKETAIRQCREQDSFAAVAFLAGQTDPVAATGAFSEVMRHFYWKEKDLPLSLAFGRAGVQHGLTEALRIEAADPKKAYLLRSAAKAMAYDLASFTWPGWDEKGIAIADSDLRVGLDAARTNLRLAEELKKGDLPLSRAYWVLGAQQWAADQPTSALESFAKASDYAKAANVDSESLLCQGYAALVRVVQSKDATAIEQFDSIIKQLKGVQDGDSFIEQLKTARQVFSR